MSAGIFKRLFGGEGGQGGIADVRRWADKAGHRFAIGRGGEGFVIETRGGPRAIRVEWGPSQRSYIPGRELRLRADIGASDVHLLAATRELVGKLESDAFSQFTEGNETRIDDELPEEMRWIVMYPKLPSSALGALAERFVVLASRPRAGALWLEEGLSAALGASAEWLAPSSTMALIVQRGRFAMRLACDEPTPAVVAGAFALGSSAAGSARRVAEEVRRGGLSSQGPSTWEAPTRSPHEENEG